MNIFRARFVRHYEGYILQGFQNFAFLMNRERMNRERVKKKPFSMFF